MKETIEWFDYPGVKPTNDKKYLICSEDNYVDIYTFRDKGLPTGFYAEDWRSGALVSIPFSYRVIAWANMPRGVRNDK